MEEVEKAAARKPATQGVAGQGLEQAASKEDPTQKEMDVLHRANHSNAM